MNDERNFLISERPNDAVKPTAKNKQLVKIYSLQVMHAVGIQQSEQPGTSNAHMSACIYGFVQSQAAALYLKVNAS
jgi:hypothetical protein